MKLILLLPVLFSVPLLIAGCNQKETSGPKTQTTTTTPGGQTTTTMEKKFEKTADSQTTTTIQTIETKGDNRPESSP
jgi:hypothetical protein